MKWILAILLVTAMLLLYGCAGNSGTPAPSGPAPSAPTPAPSVVVPVVNHTNTLPPQMANPASLNCIQKGGNLRIVTDASGGQVGECDLPDGTTCEEWAYMRGDCPATMNSSNATVPSAPADNATVPSNSSNETNASSTAPSAPPAPPVQEITMYATRFTYNPDAITVKAGTHVILHLSSNDVVHGFSLPDFGVDTVLNPGQTQTVEFDANKAGTFTFRCSVVCGGGHGQMMGTLTVTN